MFEAGRFFGKVEKNEQVLVISESLSVLKAERRDEGNLDDCTYVLITCQAWIEELEAAELDDKHPLLEDLRSYMQKYLPTYILAYNKSAQEQMERGFNKE